MGAPSYQIQSPQTSQPGGKGAAGGMGGRQPVGDFNDPQFDAANQNLMRRLGGFNGDPALQFIQSQAPIGADNLPPGSGLNPNIRQQMAEKDMSTMTFPGGPIQTQVPIGTPTGVSGADSDHWKYLDFGSSMRANDHPSNVSNLDPKFSQLMAEKDRSTMTFPGGSGQNPQANISRSIGKGGRVTYPGQTAQPQMGQPNQYSNTVGPWDNANIGTRPSGKGKGA